MDAGLLLIETLTQNTPFTTSGRIENRDRLFGIAIHTDFRRLQTLHMEYMSDMSKMEGCHSRISRAMVTTKLTAFYAGNTESRPMAAQHCSRTDVPRTNQEIPRDPFTLQAIALTTI